MSIMHGLDNELMPDQPDTAAGEIHCVRALWNNRFPTGSSGLLWINGNDASACGIQGSLEIEQALVGAGELVSGIEPLDDWGHSAVWRTEIQRVNILKPFVSHLPLAAG